MTDDLLEGLPEPPRIADNVVRLPSADLSQLFRESLPTHPRLTPAQVHMATLMDRAGRDAGAIAERIDASLGTVLDFLDRLRKLEAKRAAAAAEQEAGREPAARKVTPAPSLAPTELPRAPVSPDDPAPTPKERPPLPPPDIELTGLQISLIRRSRKLRVPAATIARMMRMSTDQVLRVAGEAP